MSRRRRKSAKLSAAPVTVNIESLSHDGRGIAHVDDKVVFINGALPGEQVRFQYVKTHRNHDEGKVVEVLRASDDRVEPGCDFFSLCGGCSMQHVATEKQIYIKQDIMLNHLSRTGHVKPGKVLPPLVADHWGYRTKARLGVKFVNKKGRVLVGFREKHSPFLADMDRCEILDARVGHKLDVLATCIGDLDSREKIAQIEVATTEDAVALIFRNLVELSRDDCDRLIRLAKDEDFHVYLQPAGPESVTLLYPAKSTLSYTLVDYDINIQFRPMDFTQINTSINNQMIRQALDLLAVSKEDDVLDLFCGLGNFTLPVARNATSVVGVEGDAGLIDRARENAELNNVSNAGFFVHDLSVEPGNASWFKKKYSKILLDPARPGALEMMGHVAGMGPERIVYVSCNPATLARDAGELVNRYGYRLESVGVMDMFPHTAHIESMALFVK